MASIPMKVTGHSVVRQQQLVARPQGQHRFVSPELKEVFKHECYDHRIPVFKFSLILFKKDMIICYNNEFPVILN